MRVLSAPLKRDGAVAIKLALAIGAVLLLVWFAKDRGQSLESSTPNSSGPGKIGRQVERNGIALTVVNVVRRESLGTFQKPEAGRIFLVVDVLLETTTRDSAPYNPLYFKVKDRTGVEYTQSFHSSGDSLKSGTLAKGDRVRGTVAFEINSNADGLLLTYEPLVILGGYEPLGVRLER